MNTKPKLKLALTAEQVFALQPLFDELGRMQAEGKNGMLLAQLMPDGMAVGLLDNEQALRVIEAFRPGTDKTIGISSCFGPTFKIESGG